MSVETRHPRIKGEASGKKEEGRLETRPWIPTPLKGRKPNRGMLFKEGEVEVALKPDVVITSAPPPLNTEHGSGHRACFSFYFVALALFLALPRGL